jgi:hypothetical protein
MSHRVFETIELLARHNRPLHVRCRRARPDCPTPGSADRGGRSADSPAQPALRPTPTTPPSDPRESDLSEMRRSDSTPQPLPLRRGALVLDREHLGNDWMALAGGSKRGVPTTRGFGVHTPPGPESVHTGFGRPSTSRTSPAPPAGSVCAGRWRRFWSDATLDTAMTVDGSRR